MPEAKPWPERPAAKQQERGEPDTGERHVVLVGLMGVGKSTVGRRLAKEMERPFADADEQVELRAGRAIPAIFRTGGEDEFRRLETEVLADLVARPHPLVVAAGGGAVSRAQNRALLAPRSFVVWLRASAEFLAERTDAAHRPLLAGSDDPAATLRRLLAERTPLYEAIADAVVDVEPFHQGEDEKPKRAIAQHIVALAREAGAAAPAPMPATEPAPEIGAMAPASGAGSPTGQAGPVVGRAGGAGGVG